MNERVKQIMCDLLKVPESEMDASVSMKTCRKWDSLAHVNLMLGIEQEFGISLSTDELQRMVSYEEIVAVLRRKHALDE